MRGYVGKEGAQDWEGPRDCPKKRAGFFYGEGSSSCADQTDRVEQNDLLGAHSVDWLPRNCSQPRCCLCLAWGYSTQNLLGLAREVGARKGLQDLVEDSGICSSGGSSRDKGPGHCKSESGSGSGRGERRLQEGRRAVQFHGTQPNQFSLLSLVSLLLCYLTFGSADSANPESSGGVEYSEKPSEPWDCGEQHGGHDPENPGA